MNKGNLESYTAKCAGFVGDLFVISVEGRRPLSLDREKVDPKFAREVVAGSQIIVSRGRGSRMDDLANLVGYSLDLPISSVCVSADGNVYSRIYNDPNV